MGNTGTWARWSSKSNLGNLTRQPRGSAWHPVMRRRAQKLFHSILSLRFRCTLPLHVLPRIGTAALQRSDVINHISGTMAGRQSR